MSSNSPCAACKFQRRKCTPECIFAPYFPPEDPQKFVNVHKVFGGSNVSKILSDLNPAQREDAAKSLAFEAEARLRDPIYGCVGFISYLQQRLKQIQVDLTNARKELSSYIGPSAMLPTLPQHAYGQMVYHPQQQQMMGNQLSSSSTFPYTNLMGTPAVYGPGTSQQLVIREQQQQQIIGGGNPTSSAAALPYTSLMPSMIGDGGSSQPLLIREPQQLHGVDPQQYGAVDAAEQHEMIRNYEQQQQDYFLLRSSDQYEPGGGQILGSGFIQMAADETGGGPSLALGVNYDNPYSQVQQQQQQEVVHQSLQAQLVLQSRQQHAEHVLQTPLHQHPQNNADSNEGRSADPSC
uniref:LOB domain-containing protein n=1 Tax=Kalanchoe fedtschenkoi TaxID=63787 RepID=A0A7N0UBE4_KALFE